MYIEILYCVNVIAIKFVLGLHNLNVDIIEVSLQLCIVICT